MAQNKSGPFYFITCRFHNIGKKEFYSVYIMSLMLIKAMLNMSAASCYNRSRSFPELFYCPISQILTDLFQAGYHNFLQMFYVPNLLTVKRLL